MTHKKTAAVLLALSLAFSAAGCGAAGERSAAETLSSGLGRTASEVTAEESADTAENSAAIEELFSARDLSGESGEAVTVTLSGSTAKADGAGVAIENGVITISAPGSYLLTGSYEGRVAIAVGDEDKVQLILSDAHISSEGASAICVSSADKLFLTLAEGTENSISASGTLAALGELNADGAVFAKCDLTVNGTGSLAVVCEQGHGLVSKDDLKIASAALDIQAGKQGLSGKDSVSIASGTLTIRAGTDGIHSETDNAEKGTVKLLGGEITIVSGSDGVDAVNDVTLSGGTLSIRAGDDGVHSDATLTITGGRVTVEKSYEGLEARDIVISGGMIDVTASDDGLNAAGGNDQSGWGGHFGRGGDPFAAQDVSIVISGGTLHVNASGDGIDSNGELTVTGGTITVSGPTNSGNGAIDYNGTAVISGGTIVAAGALGMAENFSSASTQPSMLVGFSGTVSGGTEIRLTDADGKLILSYTPEKDYQCAVISAPELTIGETYTVSAGAQSQSISLSSVIYGSGGMGGMGGPGGMGGMPGWGGNGGQGGPGGQGGQGGQGGWGGRRP